jgi:tryptophanyl-tRNA synthetase
VLRPAFTDPARLRRTDPGNPDICNIFTMHQGFSGEDTIAEVDRECRRAGIGCFDCKMKLADSMNAVLGPVRERARRLTERPEEVRSALDDGASFCGKVAADTMAEVREAMGLR